MAYPVRKAPKLAEEDSHEYSILVERRKTSTPYRRSSGMMRSPSTSSRNCCSRAARRRRQGPQAAGISKQAGGA